MQISDSSSEEKSQKEQEQIEKGMDIEPNKIILNWNYKDIKKKLTYDIEKCIGCSLCKVVCPVDAIELGPIAEIAQGLIDESNPKLLIDHEKCCYCMLCAVVCPNDAFHENIIPEGEIDLEQFPKLGKFYERDEERCVIDESKEICKLCIEARERNRVKDYYRIQKECPEKCFKIRSPINGNVVLKENMLWKCDPSGCKACVNICPVDSFFIPETAEDVKKYGKIACNEDECFYCGACVNSCPDDLIIVERNEIEIDDPQKEGNYPWIQGWIKNIKQILRDQLIKEEKPHQIPLIQQEIQEKKEEIEEEVPQLSNEERAILNELNKKVQSFLKLKKVRYWIKDGKAEKVGKELKKLLSK
ncbi:MAG: 4Fe-4S dicluster domain-containing protein [Candidatus Lokiarchaeota archaeon]|nr:4Fe-4S dicluster domain-containing protein [Candidatus Lokiarchaeota archaeon]MBD3199670.1 4Fe-4S dicluster domain-containing protein [Candidatus Lokiarchaeota archaeon]